MQAIISNRTSSCVEPSKASILTVGLFTSKAVRQHQFLALRIIFSMILRQTD